MIRRCNGTDPNLIQYLTTNGDRTASRFDGEHRVPCDCGKVFNDINYMTIWPHGRV